MSSMDNFLSQQAQALELEKQRLYGGDDDSDGRSLADGLDSGNGGAGGDTSDDRPETARSDKSQKNELNHALSAGGPLDAEGDRVSLTGRKNRQQNEDSKYTGDSFYSHFPSFSNQDKQREHLVQLRHQEYQEHLTKIAKKEASETKRKQQNHQNYADDHRDDVSVRSENPISGPFSNHHNANDPIKFHSPGNPYDHKEMLNGLKHSNTLEVGGSNNQSASIIKDTNEECAKEATRKKMEYQRDLMKQIEEKKQEAKALRARDKAEDEQMTKYACDRSPNWPFSCNSNDSQSR